MSSARRFDDDLDDRSMLGPEKPSSTSGNICYQSLPVVAAFACCIVLLAVISFTFFVVGFSTHHWFYPANGVTSHHVGLFDLCLSEESLCDSYPSTCPYSNYKTERESVLGLVIAAAAVVIIGSVCMYLPLVFLAGICRSFTLSRILLCCTGLFVFLGAALGTAGVLVAALSLHDGTVNCNGVSGVGFCTPPSLCPNPATCTSCPYGYSFILSCIAIPLATVVAILICASPLPKRRSKKLPTRALPPRLPPPLRTLPSHVPRDERCDLCCARCTPDHPISDHLPCPDCTREPLPLGPPADRHPHHQMSLTREPRFPPPITRHVEFEHEMAARHGGGHSHGIAFDKFSHAPRGPGGGRSLIPPGSAHISNTHGGGLPVQDPPFLGPKFLRDHEASLTREEYVMTMERGPPGMVPLPNLREGGFDPLRMELPPEATYPPTF